MTLSVFAPAKINLSLHVTGQRADGYHFLDSLVAFVDVGDTISARAAGANSLLISGPMADGVPSDQSNLMMRAAALSGVSMAMELEKHLPASSGIGGGSSDAAATLEAARQLGGEAVSPREILRLGADVPVCMVACPTRMRGIGDQIDAIEMPALHMVLVNPRVPVSTPDVFKALASKENDPMPEDLPRWPDTIALVDWLSTQRNDLQDAAVKTTPEIAAALIALALAPEVLMVRMSGSGATCYGLFADREKADAAAETISDSNPWWWVKSASTLTV